ncbi:MAG: hypothetical protein QHJ74_03475 [Anaerolineae bacterium]|jgi:hypothetical protein|nr:hypothetical protein [Anaerolineae bacterium]
MKAAGNTLRRSSVPLETHVLNNFPGRYPTEDWRVTYWYVTEDGQLADNEVILQLPAGYARVCQPIAPGQDGCVYHVRRWGVACRTSLLEAMGFDPAVLVPSLPEQSEDSAGQELLSAMLRVTWFDLPGYFVIASDEHPLLLFDPEDYLKGSYTRWRTYLGALAFLVSGGKVNADFIRLYREFPVSYDQAVEILLEMLD